MLFKSCDGEVKRVAHTSGVMMLVGKEPVNLPVEVHKGLKECAMAAGCVPVGDDEYDKSVKAAANSSAATQAEIDAKVAAGIAAAQAEIDKKIADAQADIDQKIADGIAAGIAAANVAARAAAKPAPAAATTTITTEAKAPKTAKAEILPD